MQHKAISNLFFVTILLSALIAAASVLAGPMPMLDAEQRKKWHAVGRVNSAGFSKRTGCSGTLIAPDLVVTAAHCTGTDDSVQQRQHFVSGWYRDEFTAHRVSDQVIVHPLYAMAKGSAKFAYDLALIQLAEPIPRSLVSPIPLRTPNDFRPEWAWLIGYQNSRPHALSGHEACPVIRALERVSLYACEVVNGVSGGAVIVETETGPALAAVIVARHGEHGNAVVVPVNEWLFDAWNSALLREKARR